jgi:tetratricopeptide (TPR) repeat protein
LKTFKEKQNIAHIIEDYLFDIIKDVFFSIYVSNEQILHQEFSDFVKIFEKYMRNIEGVSLVVDSDSSSNGTTYYFKSKTLSGAGDFSKAIRRFDKFIEIYLEAPEEAMKLVAKEYANSAEVFDAMQGVMKKYQRLLLDIKHQQQRIVMLMKQDFENVSLENEMYSEELSLLNSKGLIKDSTYFIGGKINSFELSASGESYSKNDTEIMQIISKYGSQEDLTLVKSSIDKLKDNDASQTDKISSAEKVKGFLIKVAKKTGEHAGTIGVKVLTTYLDNLVKGAMS